jgi:hypothetical protein
LAHIIILDKSKLFGAVLGDTVAGSSRAHTLIENNLVSNETAINAKLDVIADFLSDYASDLAGHIADLEALLPSE